MSSYSQESFETADDIFDTISEEYEGIADFEANVEIVMSGTKMSGKMTFKSPNMLRIDFDKPSDQVLVINAKQIALYLPSYKVTMVQDLKGGNYSRSLGLGSAEGLSLLRKGYTKSFLKTPSPVPLDEQSEAADGEVDNTDTTMVYKLKLVWKSSSEGFKQIILSIDAKTNLIRRVEAVGKESQVIVIDYMNMQVNQNIVDAVFEYDPSSKGFVQNDFLFDSSNK